MGKTFFAGGALILAGVLAVLLDSLLGLGLGFVLLGIAIGGALGLSRDGSPLGRIGAYVVGLLIMVVAFVGRVLLGNSSTVGLIAGIIAVLVPLTIVCALTRNRLPLSAGLLGVVTVVGAYETAFGLAPQNILSELLPSVTAVVFPVALGFIASVFFSIEPSPPAPEQEPGEYNTWSQPPVASTANTGTATTNEGI
jgi:hypothetical protein